MTKYEVSSTREAIEEAKILIERSQLFTVTPLPDDEYQFEVRDGEARKREK